MATRIIGVTDKFINTFSNYGRQRNHLFKELNEVGLKHIRERKLPDNSRVILGYQDKDAQRALFAFKVNPDLTMIQKTTSSSHALLPFKDVTNTITRVFADKTGNAVKTEHQTAKYINDKLVYKSNIKCKGDAHKSVQIDKNGSGFISNLDNSLNKSEKVIKSVEFKNGKDYYGFAEQADGTRNYVKNIDGVEYSFTTKRS